MWATLAVHAQLSVHKDSRRHIEFMYCIMPNLSHRIGSSFQEQYTHQNEKAGKHRNLCNNFFTGWDFNITQKQLAGSRHKAIKTKLQVCMFVCIYVDTHPFILLAIYLSSHPSNYASVCLSAEVFAGLDVMNAF